MVQLVRATRRTEAGSGPDRRLRLAGRLDEALVALEQAEARVAGRRQPVEQPTASPPPAVSAPQMVDVTGKTLSTEARIVVVEWKIKKGHEQDFLDYWTTKSTIPDRSGLIAEFMSG